MWHATCDAWPKTCDMLHVTCYMWHKRFGEHGLKMSGPYEKWFSSEMSNGKQKRESINFTKHPLHPNLLYYILWNSMLTLNCTAIDLIHYTTLYKIYTALWCLHCPTCTSLNSSFRQFGSTSDFVSNLFGFLIHWLPYFHNCFCFPIWRYRNHVCKILTNGWFSLFS